MLECQQQEDLKPRTSPALSNVSTSTQRKVALDATAIAPHLVSEFERVHYWHGISMDPPELLYRSDLKTNPFPVPPPGARWSELPVKTAEGVFRTQLNVVWHTVAPMIIALLKNCRIKYSVLKAARFSTRNKQGRKKLGPIVIWIATHPNTTTAENARDASPRILRILEQQNVKDAVVEWYEGSVEKLIGPPLMRVAEETNPTHYVRRPFTALLGMPIAAKEMQSDDAQGSVSFFFHENWNNKGEPSNRVFAVSNKHVLCKDTTVDYQFAGGGAPHQGIRVCGLRRFQRSIDETEGLVAKNVAEAVRLVEEIERLMATPKSTDYEQAEEEQEALQIKKVHLNKVNEDNRKLQLFVKEVKANWNNIAHREIGIIDWAPKISVSSEAPCYTLDIGTVVLDSQKFKDRFQGNVVDLGAFCLISLMLIYLAS